MDKKSPPLKNRSLLWDAFCITSVVGIWPRFIEPQLLHTKKISLQIPNLAPSLAGTKIVQISDLHINPSVSDAFLDKVTKSINALQPDIITITGDLLCYAQLGEEAQRLERFLQGLSAPHGCFVVLGNHDYATYVTVAPNGDYDVENKAKTPFSKVLSRLFRRTKLTKHVTDAAKTTPLHSDLTELLKRTPFTLLHNETVQTVLQGSPLNITGLGEYTLSRTDPNKAFAKYQNDCPGIILLHNPDGLPLLKGFSGDVVLCGHTHGGQVNLPWVWDKLTLIENKKLKSGPFRIDDKWVYINRGISGTLPFRWFAMPEILALTLEAAP